MHSKIYAQILGHVKQALQDTVYPDTVYPEIELSQGLSNYSPVLSDTLFFLIFLSLNTKAA